MAKRFRGIMKCPKCNEIYDVSITEKARTTWGDPHCENCDVKLKPAPKEDERTGLF